MSEMVIDWEARQVCAECGEGSFLVPTSGPVGPTCVECGHEHPVDPWNLGDGESFVTDAGGFLAVRCVGVAA